MDKIFIFSFILIKLSTELKERNKLFDQIGKLLSFHTKLIFSFELLNFYGNND